MFYKITISTKTIDTILHNWRLTRQSITRVHRNLGVYQNSYQYYDNSFHTFNDKTALKIAKIINSFGLRVNIYEWHRELGRQGSWVLSVDLMKLVNKSKKKKEGEVEDRNLKGE